MKIYPMELMLERKCFALLIFLSVSFTDGKPVYGAPLHENLQQRLFTVEVSDPDFTFSYPEFWLPIPVTNEQIEGKSGVDLKLISEGELLAYLRIKAIDLTVHPDRSVEKLVATATEEIEQTGLQISSKWRSDSDLSLAVRDLRGAFATEISNQTNDPAMEIYLGIVERDRLIFVVTLITVAESLNETLNSASRYAYIIALESSR